MASNPNSELSALAGAAARLGTKYVGSRILVYDSVSSTNEIAAELARKRDFVEGEVVFADEQTAGRGRFERKWICPKGKGILMSAILTPKLDLRHLPAITAIGALAVVEAIERAASVSGKIRWPNDVVVGREKIAGVLAKIENAPAPCFILGIGLNVNVSAREFPRDIPPATSLYIICNRRPIDRLAVARALLRSLDGWYAALKAGDFASIEARIRELSSVVGARVTIKSGEDVFSGLAEDVSLTDGLLVALPDGTSRWFHESASALVY